MGQIYQYLPQELVTFLLVAVFSLLIGLSQRRISLKREGETTLFGTDRTFTFIGILGYLLYILEPEGYRLFIGGGLVLGVLLAVFARSRGKARLLSAACAAGALVLTLLTAGWNGFVLADAWTLPVAALALLAAYFSRRAQTPVSEDDR